MKRINKNTGVAYKSGDQPTEDDLPLRQGKLFYQDDSRRLKKDGYFEENWVTPERLEEMRADSRRRVKENVERNFKKGKGKFELNPTTKKKWQKGEWCPRRGYFYLYSQYVIDGFFQMVFYKTREKYDRRRIREILYEKPAQSRKEGVPYDLDLNYVLDIFPKDYRCPVLKKKMEWSSSPRNPNSPSLDRIEPNKGYVKGNISWISNRANSMKNDATFEEVELIYNWFKKNV